jgi:osmotically-inducible protein OsmY
MPNRKRNQPGIFTHAAQGYSQPMRSRFESIYGTEYDDVENYEGAPYHSPRRPVAPPYANSEPERREWSSYYNERDRRNFSNYGDGGYYGPTYNQANEWNQNTEQNRGRLEGWRNSDERYQMGRRQESERDLNSRDQFDYGNEYNRSGRDPKGEHRGKGPRGYQRADDRIRDDINDRLADDSYLDATEIEVVVLNGEVTLSGEVEGRQDKRRAEDLCEGVSGVRNVENRIRVKRTFGDANRKTESEAGDAQRKRTTSSETIRNFN